MFLNKGVHRILTLKTVFTSGANLRSILCQNKSKLIPHSYPGVYTLNCSCNADYIGETKKKVITRTIEHQQDSIKGKWKSSGATEHCLQCDGQFNWLHPKTLSREARYKSRKIRESLEIIRSKCNSSKLNINRDDGNFVKTNTWTPLLRNISDLESALRNQRSRCKADMTSN